MLSKIAVGKSRIDLFPILLMLPAVLLIVLILVGPILYSIYLSLTDYFPIRRDTYNFIGLANFLSLWQTEEFVDAFKITVLYMIAVVAMQFVIGTSVAIILNREFRLKNVMRTLYFLPFMITPVASGLQWKWLYSYEFGLINYILRLVGIEGRAWLSELSTVWQSIIVVSLWRETPWVIMLMLAGFQSLPDELFEAARIDGSSRWQELWHVAFPLLMPIILVVLIMRSIFSFRVFDIIFVLTAGGPANFTQTIALYGYRVGFDHWRIGLSSAISVVMLIVLAILGYFYIRVMRTRVD